MTDTPTERAAESTWTRLRRRKVVQWGLAYGAGAWGLLQGLQFLAETYEWSSRVLKLSTLALVIGLPIVLVLAWYHGDRGEQRIRGTELAIITLLFLLAGVVFWRYERASETATPATQAATRPKWLLHPTRSRSPCCPSLICRRRKISSTCLTASRRSC